jgi:hypothetical protein
MDQESLVSVGAGDLWIPNVVGKVLQQALDRVLNARTLGRLAAPGGQGASCKIYPKPLGASIGAVNMLMADLPGKVCLVIALYPLRHEYETGGVHIPETTARAIGFRLDGTDKTYGMRLNWETRAAQLLLCLPLQTLQQHPRLLVGPQR